MDVLVNVGGLRYDAVNRARWDRLAAGDKPNCGKCHRPLFPECKANRGLHQSERPRKAASWKRT